MNQDQRRDLADAMTERADELRERLSQVFQDMDMGDLEVTEFKVAPREDQPAKLKTLGMGLDEATLLQAAPCPTVCVVTPSGAIHCFPRC